MGESHEPMNLNEKKCFKIFFSLYNYFKRYNYLKIWNLWVQKNIEKIAFKVVKIKFLAMHVTNQKLSFDIFIVGNLQNIFMEHDPYLIS